MSLKLALFNGWNIFVPHRGFFAARRIWLRKSGLNIGERVRIATGTKFYDKYISIGNDTWVGPEVSIFSHKRGSVQIGKNVDVGPRAVFAAGSHELGPQYRRAGVGKGMKIEIGDGTWIGAGAIILGGAIVGKGSMVAAGAVVKKGKYPDNVMLAGIPAEVVRNFKQGERS